MVPNTEAFFDMSQDFSFFPPDLLLKLSVDIFKFKQYGPPTFRLNVPCKHKDQCKYGKYSCNYSHECFCKFQKNNRKCANSSCTHNHALPLEFQLAQALFMDKTQIPSFPVSTENPNSTSDRQFLGYSASQSDPSRNTVFRFKVHDSPTESHETNSNNNNTNSTQPRKQAEAHFSAFSPMFQKPVKSDLIDTAQKRSTTHLNPVQNASKRPTNVPKSNHFPPSSAQQQLKSSDSSTKAAYQNEGLPPRISAPNQFPPQ